MKGRKLTLQEVLNLEDGRKVWVEELNEKYKELSSLHIMDDKALQNHEKFEAYDFESLEFYKDELEFYEWIEEETPLHKMSVEIVNIRGLDLTDDNIESIIEEFEEEK